MVPSARSEPILTPKRPRLTFSLSFAATWVDRLTAITMPLLEGIAREWDRPQIKYPDLVELNSGFWDLRKYTEGEFPSASASCSR